MDANDDGTREKILTSIVLDNNLTIIQRSDYFAAYGIRDNSSLDVSSEDENSMPLNTFWTPPTLHLLRVTSDEDNSDAKGKEKELQPH